MRWSPPAGTTGTSSGGELWLGYCMNLHAGEGFSSVMAGLREITLPLRDRLWAGGEFEGEFGVGMYLPAAVAFALDSPRGGVELDALASLLAGEGLVPFTFNAFPFGGFHRKGLKADVFRPTWANPERLEYTLAVARIAAALKPVSAGPDGSGEGGHLSISTHPGTFGSWIRSERDLEECARQLGRCALELSRLEGETGQRVVLSLEAEPRASAGDTAELAAFRHLIRGHGGRFLEREGVDDPEALIARHLGTCLDTCHAAVEFEQPEAALANATAGGAPLGKLQFSSAPRLALPGENAVGRARLLGMAEPVYLHQVTGRLPGTPGDRRGSNGGFLRAGDLPELARECEGPASLWLECEEWRCHFHVPVDVGDSLGVQGLGTTRDVADRILALALGAPHSRGTRDLHLEIETYTWDVLPGSVRGPGSTVEGLEREYRHVLGRLSAAGWTPAPLKSARP